jgi:hypothetical protein
VTAQGSSHAGIVSDGDHLPTRLVSLAVESRAASLGLTRGSEASASCPVSRVSGWGLGTAKIAACEHHSATRTLHLGRSW